MNDKEFCNEVHMEIHAVRRINNYKANPMEVNISKIVIERFKEECRECKEVSEKKIKEPQRKDKGFFSKLKEMEFE